MFLCKFNDFVGRRGHVPKWCTVRSYESAANALICAKGAMPVSRGLPLIVVYALYYAILLYGRWVFDVLTEICACVDPHIGAHIYISRAWRYVIDRIRVRVIANVYQYDRGSQILCSLILSLTRSYNVSFFISSKRVLYWRICINSWRIYIN